MGKWQPLNRAQALAARDFSRAGQTFIDHKDKVNEILYSIITPLSYEAFVSAQKLRHAGMHPFASKHLKDISYILNNPDLVTPNPDNHQTHIFYKVYNGNTLAAVIVHVREGIRFMATMYTMLRIKGLKERRLLASEFLYLRGGFKWKKWK
jgi:hypothetical protein